MMRPDLDGLPSLEQSMAALGPEYGLRTYREGDEAIWAEIMNYGQMGHWDAEHTREKLTGLPQFDPLGLFFITYGPQQVAVGSACAWLMTPEEREEGRLHMVCVVPEHRGRNLSYPVCLAALHRFRERGLRRASLNTSDWRLGAVKVYLRLGFQPWYRHPMHPEIWRDVLETLAWKAPIEPVIQS